MNSLLRILLVSLAIFVVLDAAVTKPRWQSRIIGGKRAPKNIYPFMAGIGFLNRDGPMAMTCGGVILNERVILSSANCIVIMRETDQKLSQFIAVLGSPLTNEDTDAYAKIDRYFIHPEFNEDTRFFDLSLLRTSEPIIFSNIIQPCTLPAADLSPNGGVAVIVAGWGLLSEGSGGYFSFPEYTEKLHTYKTTTLNEDLCIQFRQYENEQIRKLEHTEFNNTCTDNVEGVGIAFGDSGSPLITDDGVVVGISVLTINQWAKGNPDVFTRTYPHLEWIKTGMNGIVYGQLGVDIL